MQVSEPGELNYCMYVQYESTNIVIHLPQSVELWYAALGDRQSLMTAPEWHCAMLRSAADGLLRAGKVSCSDYLDLLDLATGAQAHALEERAAQWFRPNRLYQVLHDGNEVGRIARGAFHATAPELSGGLVRYDKRGRLAMFQHYTIYAGDIRGRRWECTDGRTYALTVVGCAWNGTSWPAFNDPDEYRLALAMAECAEDAGDGEMAAVWRERLEACELQTCRACRAHFALMDTCQACAGAGVVRVGDCPAGTC